MCDMTLNEKACYIKGLCEGLDLGDSKEGKIIAALLDLVSDMAVTIEDLEAEVEELGEYIEEIDEDLGDVEELLCDDCDDDYDCDGDCCNCDEECELADDDYFEVECPSCGETICFDESIDPEELVCPACGEKFECVIAEEDLKALDEE